MRKTGRGAFFLGVHPQDAGHQVDQMELLCSIGTYNIVLNAGKIVFHVRAQFLSAESGRSGQ